MAALDITFHKKVIKSVKFKLLSDDSCSEYLIQNGAKRLFWYKFTSFKELLQKWHILKKNMSKRTDLYLKKV